MFYVQPIPYPNGNYCPSYSLLTCCYNHLGSGRLFHAVYSSFLRPTGFSIGLLLGSNPPWVQLGRIIHKLAFGRGAGQRGDGGTRRGPFIVADHNHSGLSAGLLLRRIPILASLRRRRCNCPSSSNTRFRSSRLSSGLRSKLLDNFLELHGALRHIVFHGIVFQLVGQFLLAVLEGLEAFRRNSDAKDFEELPEGAGDSK